VSTSSATVATLPIASLRLDGDTQARGSINPAVVDDYRERMEAGDTFPPIVVFDDGAELWVADGFHRLQAAAAAGHTHAPAEVRTGTREEARWYAAGANRTHGLRRTRADIRRAVEVALRLRPEASDRAIGDHCGVDHKTVGAARTRLAGGGEIPQVDARTGLDGKAYGLPAVRLPTDPEPRSATEETAAPIDDPTEPRFVQADLFPMLTAVSVPPARRKRTYFQVAVDSMLRLHPEQQRALIAALLARLGEGPAGGAP